MGALKFSRFNGISPKSKNTITISEYVELLSSDEMSEKISSIRTYVKNGDFEKAKKEKLSLPSVTPSCTVDGHRSGEYIKEYNGLVIIDIDRGGMPHGMNPELLRSQLSEDEYVHLAHVSPRYGVKALIRVDSGLAAHKAAYNQVRNYFEEKFGLKLDASGCDPVRLCFASYDPDPYFNEQSQVFHVEPVKQSKKGKDRGIKRSSGKGESGDYKTIERIIDFLEKEGESITYDYNDWIRTGFALVNTFAEDGAVYFHRLSEFDEDKYVYQECSEKWTELIESEGNGEKVTIATIVELAKEKGFDAKGQKSTIDGVFWRVVTSEKGNIRIEIIIHKFLSFLSDNGFFRKGTPEGKLLVRLTDNILEEVDESVIKHFVMGYIDSLESIDSHVVDVSDLKERILREESTLFSRNKLEFLRELDDRLHKDAPDTSYFYFRNGFVGVTADGMELKPYTELISYIWCDWIMPFDFTKEQQVMDCVFASFIKNVTGDPERENAMRSAIGYLLHRYNKQTLSKAVILMDESLNDLGEANGGTGKTLISRSLGKVRGVVEIDGKKDIERDNFAYSEVTPATSIVSIDDLKDRFNFEYLYSDITSGIKVNRKHKEAYSIPQDESPKILLTTNYIVSGGGGNSESRRKFIVELTDYYGELRPDVEFGHSFFLDWDSAEWNRFYNYMLQCCLFYLREGLTGYTGGNSEEKEYLLTVGIEFHEFVMGQAKEGDEVALKDLLQHFKTVYQDTRSVKNLTQRGFNKKLKKFIDYYGLTTRAVINGNKKGPYHERNGVQYITMYSEGSKLVLPKSDPKKAGAGRRAA